MLFVASEASHTESDRKSDRIHLSWIKRQQKAIEGKIIRRQAPGWLRIVNDTFESIPNRVSLVQEMFKVAAEGRGVLSISRELNEKVVPTWSRGKIWYPDTILTSRKVLDEFQLILYGKPKNGQQKKINPNHES
jgi:hypothetical protein